jgi:hypothetical protein
MTKVTVTSDANGNIIGVSENNPDYGYVRVEQSVTQYSDQGWLRISKRSALIKGLVQDLQTVGFTAGQELSGKIVVKESLTPFNLNNPERDLKIAGDTGVVCRVDDQPIFRQTFYTTDPNSVDELITHTNSEEIRDVQAALKSLNSVIKPKKSVKETEVL